MIIDLTIDQVSQILGVPKCRLRYWEKVFEVLVTRTPANRRRYSQETINILKRIKELSDYGFAARGIKKKLKEKVALGGPPADPSCID